MKNNDNLFIGREIFDESLYVKGIYPAAIAGSDVFVKRDASDRRSVVLNVKHGNAYEVKFAEKPKMLRCALCDKNPLDMADGEGMAAVCAKNLRYYQGQPTDENVDFLCTPTTHDQYLVIYTGDGENAPLSITEHPILLGHDTDDCWFCCPEAGDVLGNEDSWGDYNWTSDELIEKIYEPLRAKYPEYITRTWIGKENTGKYDMWSYKFEPEDYEQTLFFTSGLHGGEIDAFLALARFLQIMTETGLESENEGLKYLRTKVKLVVVPMVNSWASYETKQRRNSSDVDLNRDYEAHTQAETVNVIWLLHQYKDEVGALIDFHNCSKTSPGLYYQFSIQAANSAVCRKVINHIQEELKAKGYEKDPADLSLIPGAYNKSSVYLQGYAYNHFGIPTLVVEHNINRWYEVHSADAFRHAVECHANHIIQTALAKLKLLK